MVSPYEVLGIPADSTEKEIEQAYRERLKETHPDRDGSRTEFKLVKAAYKELTGETDPHSDGNRSTVSKSQHQDQRPSCSHCGSQINEMTNAVFRERTGELYCSDCSVETYCRSCGDDLLLSLPQFQQTGGRPICSSCIEKSNTRNRTTKSSPSIPNWLMFLGLMFLGLMFLLAIGYGVWYYRPSVAVSNPGIQLETVRNIARGIPWLGLLIGIWWFYRRRNN